VSLFRRIYAKKQLRPFLFILLMGVVVALAYGAQYLVGSADVAKVGQCMNDDPAPIMRTNAPSGRSSAGSEATTSQPTKRAPHTHRHRRTWNARVVAKTTYSASPRTPADPVDLADPGPRAFRGQVQDRARANHRWHNSPAWT
jgi:hypothetical protein